MADKFPYIVGQPAEIFHGGRWKRGKIVAGYRFRDGIVTIQTEKGERIWCGELRDDLYRPVNGIDVMTREEKIEKISVFYGFRPQAQMMIEECSELIKAICKWNRKYDGSFKSESSDCPDRKEIIGELADVTIMAKQLTYLLSAEDEVEHMIEFKLDRQLARMEEENADKGTE